MQIDDFDLELEKVVRIIRYNKAKKVCIQLPSGIKPYANKIYDYLEKEVSKDNCVIFIWAGSCFGACDYPYYLDKYGFDLIIQWGHSEWI
jgi:diphthamide biosynthesis enzyme Dph1/Dph2-like protein